MTPNLTSEQIEKRLGAIRARIRRVQISRGIAIVGTVALAGLILIMAADFFLAPLASSVRWALFIAWLLAVAAALRFGFAPPFRKIGLIQIARWLEGRHPEIEERLSTVLELSHEGSTVSPGFLEALASAAEKDINTVDPLSEVRDARTRKRWGRPALALLVLLILGLVIWPSQTSRLLARALAPFSDIGNAGATRFSISPGNLEVLEGDPIEIEITCTGNDPHIELWMEMHDGSKFSQSLARSGDNFRYVLDPARQSFRYRVRAGRAESDAYTATVWPLPEILKPRLTLKYPDYTGLPTDETALGRGIQTVTGTAVTLTGNLNTAIEEAWLEISGNRVADATIDNSSSGGRVSFEWTLEKGGSGEAVAKLRHRLGREAEALRFQVEVLDDKPPLVLLISPSQRELRVRPDEVFPLRYEITEDFALQSVTFEVEAGQTQSLPQDLPLLVRGSKPQRFRGSGEVVVGSLRSMFPGANEMRVRVRAADARPDDFGGPGVGYSEWVRLQIDQSAESFVRQELRQEHDGARETIEEAIRDAREARDRIESQREEIKKDQLHPDGQKRLQEAGEKLAGANEKLAELATRMEESVHATKADAVEKAAEKLQESRENLEDAPLQDTPEQRQETLADAREAAEEAIKNLEAVRQKMDEERERVQDLARVQELAQQQRELARQASENASQLAENQPTPDDWQQRQKQIEEALRQQLRERPDARADALQAQAEKAQTLAEEARAMAEAQQNLQQQTERMAQPAEPAATKEAIREALAKEQTAITEAAKAELARAREQQNDMAESLPAAAATAEQARNQIAAAEDQAAAGSAETAADAMKEAAAKADPANPAEAARAESLLQLAERQQGLAEAMAALAKDDPAAAREAMQQAQNQSLDNLIRQALAEEQAAITAEAKAAETQAQQERNKFADSLPEATAAAEQTQQQMAASQDKAAADSAKAAAEAMKQAAAIGDPANPADAAEPDAAVAQATPSEAAQAEALNALANRQESVAQALEALASDTPAAALQALQQSKAEAAAELAAAIHSMPLVEGSGPMHEAANTANQGSEKAKAAANQGQQGEQQQAAAQHEQSGQNFEQAAQALDRASREFAQAAQQAAAQSPNANQAPIPPGDLAEAFQEASQAAANEAPAGAAQQAANAAQALSQAAQAARQQMQGRQPGPPGMPGQPGMPGTEPGEDSNDPSRPAQASPGLPPELARLGISASDWEKIQATLNADVGAGGADGVPEEYRGLVKGYFESMSKKPNP